MVDPTEPDPAAGSSRRARFRDAVGHLSERSSSADLIRWMLIPGSLAVLLGLGAIGLGWYGAAEHGPRDRADPLPDLRRRARPGPRRARRPAARVHVLGGDPAQAPAGGERPSRGAVADLEDRVTAARVRAQDEAPRRLIPRGNGSRPASRGDRFRMRD